jgi:hypothetical protein
MTPRKELRDRKVIEQSNDIFAKSVEMIAYYNKAKDVKQYRRAFATLQFAKQVIGYFLFVLLLSGISMWNTTQVNPDLYSFSQAQQAWISDSISGITSIDDFWSIMTGPFLEGKD